jgi:hypothetical protein
MSGTRVTCEDVATGERESQVIENTYLLIADGTAELTHVQQYGNGTTVLTVKQRSGE